MAMEEDVVHRNIEKDVSSDTSAGCSMGKRSVMPDLWNATDVNGQDSGVCQAWSQTLIITHIHIKL